MKIKKLKVNDVIYDFADAALDALTQETANADKFLKIGSEGKLITSDIVIAKPAASANGNDYYSLLEAIAANKTGEIKMLADAVLTEQLIIPEGYDITIDYNGYYIRAAKDLVLTSNLVALSFGSTLTLEGIGGIKTNSKVYSAIGIKVDKTTTDNPKTAKLIINGGSYTGKYYALATGGAKSSHITEIEINEGEFEVYSRENGKALYIPSYNTTVKINGGKFTGSTALEIRAGKIEISDGIFTGQGVLKVEPNSGGATSNGCGISVVQHVSKLPIDLTINGGVFRGDVGFYEANPQKNDEASLAKVKVSLTGGSYASLYGGECIHADNLTAFVGEDCSIAGEIPQEYKA